MRTTTAQQTVKELCKLFASYGLPEVLVSDNGPQLVSTEMELFLKNNGIRHSLSPPYHPASNGAAERCVQTVKNALKKFILSSHKGDLSHALQNFLLHYRITPHATTGRSPAEMFLKRLPRTRFSLLKPDVSQTVRQKQDLQRKYHDVSSAKPTTFAVGEIVRVKNVYRGLEHFVKGVVAKVIGPYRYLIKIGQRCRYVHAEHLRKTGELDDNESHEFVLDAPSFDRDEPLVPPSVSNVPPPMSNAPPQMTNVAPAVSPAPPAQMTPRPIPREIPLRGTPRMTVPVPSTPVQTVPETRRSGRARRAPNRLIETM